MNILYSVFVLLIYDRLKTALDSTMSLELGPRGLLVFEDYAKGTAGNGAKNRQVIPGEVLIHQVCTGLHLMKQKNSNLIDLFQFAPTCAIG